MTLNEQKDLRTFFLNLIKVYDKTCNTRENKKIEAIFLSAWKKVLSLDHDDMLSTFEYKDEVDPHGDEYAFVILFGAIQYASTVLKRRWPALEKLILKSDIRCECDNTWHLMLLRNIYAIDVIKGRWKELEKHLIATAPASYDEIDEYWSQLYGNEIWSTNKEGFRWPEAETCSKIKSNWEYERLLKENESLQDILSRGNPSEIVKRALKMDSRWKEAEKLIQKASPEEQDAYLDHLKALDDKRKEALREQRRIAEELRAEEAERQRKNKLRRTRWAELA
jgi:hypothetical protein